MWLREPEERRVREIVVSTEAEARNISIKLLQGESFSVLARRHSVAESRDRGGDLGYITLGSDEKFQRFQEVVSNTDEDKISSHFRGPQGRYYIIKVENIRGGDIPPLYEVREDIRNILQLQKIESRRKDIVFDAKQDFRVEINESLLE